MYTARIFISSTFNDFTEERNILHREVFPRLEKLCRKYGCSFHAVDLRWGISAEDSASYTTLGICLNEIRRCMDITPRPNFIFLAGDRYGWQPLPDSIPETLFDRIRRAAAPEDSELLQRVYLRDENAVPCEYCLALRSVPESETEVRAALKRSAGKLGLAGDEYDLLFSSATHRELSERLKKNDFPQAAVCAIRTLRNIPAEEERRYYDLSEYGSPDEEARCRAEALKTTVRRATQSPIEYTLDLSETQEARENALKLFAEQVYEKLEKYLTEEFRDAAFNLLSSEHAFHEQERARLHASFVGRENLTENILSGLCPKGLRGLFRKSGNSVLVLTGEPGAGKSSLTAEVCTRYAETGRKALIRFCGLTSSASDSVRLADNLKQENARETALFIDGVERLDKPVSFLRGLFESTPQKPVVLSMSGACYEQCLKYLPDRHAHFEVRRLTPDEADRIVSKQLSLAGRKLTAEQAGAIRRTYRETLDAHHLGLQLKNALTLKSYEGAQTLTASRNRAEYAAALLNGLSAEKHLGCEISVRMAGYLLASRQGLSDMELLGILSRDEEVRREFEAGSMHLLPGDGSVLPYAYFSRVFYAMLPLLAERYSEGARVFRFDQDILKAAASDYCSALDMRQLHSCIADYFKKENNLEFLKSLLLTLAGQKKDAAADCESRYAFELPYQLLEAERYDDLYGLLKGPFFMQLMHSWNFNEYAEYWTRLEEATNHRIAEGFARTLEKAGAISRGECKAETTDRMIMICLTDLLLLRGGNADAVRLLSSALIASGEPGTADPTEILQAKSNQAQSLLDTGLYDQALECSEKLFRETPATDTVGYCSVLYVYAQSLYRKEQYARAEELFSKYNKLAVKLGKRDHIFTSLKWKASCEKAQGHLDTALQLYGELTDKYADDGNLSELIPIYFEQATAGFFKGDRKQALSYCEKTAVLCKKAGNRSWLVQTNHIRLCMLDVQKMYRQVIDVFPEYCDALTENSPGCLLPSLHFENYVKARYNLLDSEKPDGAASNDLLRVIESYCFMEKAGNIVLEDIPDCEGKYLFWNGWQYAFGTLPECLRKIILGRAPDYGFFISAFQKGAEAVYGTPDYAKLGKEAEAVFRDGSSDPDHLRVCKVYSYLATLFMHYGYSIYDRLRDENKTDNVYTAYRMSQYSWNLFVFARNHIQNKCCFNEYRFRIRQHLSQQKKLMEELKEAYDKQYAGESDFLRSLVESSKDNK